MDKKPKRKSLSLTLRNYFIAGVVVLIPIGFTLYLSKVLIGISSNNLDISKHLFLLLEKKIISFTYYFCKKRTFFCLFIISATPFFDSSNNLLN